MDESQHETEEQGSRERETPGSRTAGPDQVLDAAVLAWKRRGYHVQYRDEHLVQLARRTWPVLAAVFVTFTAVGAVVLAWRMFRSWYVVSVAVGPDGHMITHRKRFNRPPNL